MAPLGTGGRPGGYRRGGPHPEDRTPTRVKAERLSRVFLADDFAALRVGGGVGDPVPTTLGLLLDPSGLPGFRGAFARAAGAAVGYPTRTCGVAAAAAKIFTSSGPLLSLPLRGRTGGGVGLRLISPILILMLGNITRCAAVGDVFAGAAGRALQEAAANIATSGLTSMASAWLMVRTVSASDVGASRLPNHIGARGRLASWSREGRGGRTRGGALQYDSWSAGVLSARVVTALKERTLNTMGRKGWSVTVAIPSIWSFFSLG